MFRELLRDERHSVAAALRYCAARSTRREHRQILVPAHRQHPPDTRPRSSHQNATVARDHGELTEVWLASRNNAAE